MILKLAAMKFMNLSYFPSATFVLRGERVLIIEYLFLIKGEGQQRSMIKKGRNLAKAVTAKGAKLYLMFIKFEP